MSLANQRFLYKEHGKDYYTSALADEVLSFDPQTGIKTVRYGFTTLQLKYENRNNIRHWFVVNHPIKDEVRVNHPDHLLEDNNKLPIKGVIPIVKHEDELPALGCDDLPF